jgi:hypothetical protein
MNNFLYSFKNIRANLLNPRHLRAIPWSKNKSNNILFLDIEPESENYDC